ncbi:MAG: sensor histidine kinase [Flavobacteriales bacterium]|nr:sensor histidine kinase [Flavobacteriales bacterium]
MTFFVAYAVTFWSIERFIYQKIKVIYKTIHRFKRGGQKPDLDMDEDVLDEVKNNVANWADDRVHEIRELQAKDSFRREFIGNLAHELKTPVFNIQGYVLTLLDGALEDEQHNRKFLQKTAKSVERMVTLLEDLDAITSIESGVMEIEMVEFDIVDLARNVIESQEQKAAKANINIRLGDSNEKPIPVRADRVRIEQVLTNLVVNSINYGKEGGVTKVRFYDMEDNILIEVADDGIGMTEDHLPRVFERFYRVDQSRSRDLGGSGLGLAIVKHIIEGHGQTINVRSTPQVGSTFSFTLEKA